MPVRESADSRGARRARVLVRRTGERLGDARRAGGLSLREVARQLKVGHHRVARAEAGDPEALTIAFAARFAAVVGSELGVTVHPVGDPVRDKGHLALIARFRARIGRGVVVKTEVPMPIAGDQRSADLILEADGLDAVVEAETRLDDIQAVERSLAAKRRDLGATRAILLVSDTRHNREVLKLVPELASHFPVGTRACLAALARGADPGGDALVIV